jgi:tetratricopeptide (TPR) repeat protein
MGRYRIEFLVCMVLAVGTVAVYWRATGCGFVNFDDDDYVVVNPHLQSGLGAAGLRWALTTTWASNWHPLTWVSFLFDYQLHGLNPSGYHRTNVLLHAANSVLLFLLLRNMTGAVGKSAVVAALFAWHPLHVESVAWVAERKDVLSTLFGFLTLAAYAHYAARPGVPRYLLVFVLFALCLMAKPMLVTLPFVLLLLDYWPLRREASLARLFVEKLPLLCLAAGSAVLTLYAQHRGGAINSLEHLPFPWRLANAVVAYVRYVEQMFWPLNLAVFYPHPREELNWAPVALAGLLLAGFTFACLRWGRRQPYLTVGWLWYLGTLVPVIGLVQVGGQALADRYTYVPLIGLFVILAWGLPDLLAGWRVEPVVLAPVAVVALALCLVLTWGQVLTWYDGGSLWEHALHVTSGNYVAHNNLGNYLGARGRMDEAVEHYRDALRINPAYADAWNNLGAALARRSQLDEAVASYQQAVQLSPASATIHHNLGLSLLQLGRDQEALEHFAEAVRLRPGYARAHHSLGRVLERLGRTDEALERYRLAVRLHPDVPQYKESLVSLEARLGSCEREPNNGSL